MNGSDHNNAGAVAALENIKTPCSVARLVMERTDHLMLVGKGALKFARMHGFKEENLLTVEKIREGLSPQDACRYVCHRVIDRHGGKPLFGLKIVALTKNGDYGCCSIRGKIYKETGKVIGLGFSVHDTKGHRTEAGEAILPPMTEEERKSIPWR